MRTNRTTPRFIDPQGSALRRRAIAQRRGLRLTSVWLLTLVLCSQAALPVLASGRGERRGKTSVATGAKPPSPRATAKRRAAQTNAVPVTVVSAASFETAVAPDSIMAAFGTALATRTEAAATLPLPTALAGTTVTVRDSAGTDHPAQLFFVSANQVNFLLPGSAALGEAVVTVISASGVISQGAIQINQVGAGVFTANANGRGVPAANLLRLRDGQLLSESLTEPDPAGGVRARPIDPGPADDRFFLILYLTGLRRAPDPNNDNNARESVRVIVGNLELVPDYAGRQGAFEGLDQINVELDRNLIGRGRLHVTVTVNGFNAANVAEINFGAAAGNAPPQLSGFGASEATAGQTLVINGEGFAVAPADNLVRIGGLEATVEAASSNQLTVRVPFGAETGQVTVRTSQGEGRSAAAIQIRTSLSGHVETTGRQPLAGVTVKAGALQTTTDAEGVFILTGVAPGVTTVEIDGGTAQPAALYPRLRQRTNIIANRDNQLTRPIALQFSAGAVIALGSNGASAIETVTVPAPEDFAAFTAAEVGSVIFNLPSGATVSFPDGAPSNQLALTQLENSRAPFSLPKGHFSSNILQIAPYGATFSQGGQIIFPNNDGLPANATVKLFKLDQNAASPTLGSFIEAGAATVSADGRTISTQAGVITESGCYFVSALQPAQTLIGRVVDGGGNPVRRVFVTARGQESLTDGNGGFVLRLAPARASETVRVEANYLRPNARLARLTRADFVIPVNIAPVGFVRVTPDLVLPDEEVNRPPVISAPTSLSVAAGETREVDVVVSDRDNGQTVQLNLTGPTLATLNPASGNSYKLRLAPGAGDAGNFTLTLRATDSAGGVATQTIALNVTAPAPRISDFNPKSGTVGATVIITGTSLKSAFGNPLVTFAGANGARLQAFVSAATATEVRATVPNGAVTGVIDLTTSIGRAVANSSFAVDPSQTFTLTVENPSATALQGGTGTFVVRLSSNTPNFSQLAKLSLTGAPTGATVKFEPEQITAGATSTLSVVLLGNTQARTYNLTVSAQAVVDGNQLTRTADATLAVQAATQTTLSGRVLSTKNEPIPGATVSLDGKSSTTDAAGSFLLIGINAGTERPVMVNGRTAAVPNRTYPIINEPVDIVAGQANVVPYTFYLPPIDTVNEAVVVPNQPTNVTTPDAPGLLMTIPANSGLMNRDGTPVTRSSLSCVEIDRTPAPLPANVGTNMVYTSQPGGARPAPGVVIPVTYPNLSGANPGTTINLFAFDHDTARWYIYGQGRVSADGRTIVPNPGVGLRDFSWHFPNASPDGNPSPPDQCPSSRTGNTVDLATGVKIEKNTYISIGGARGGLELTRIYSSDLAQTCDNCAFGRGARHNYEVRLTGTFQLNGAGRVVMPEQRTGRLFSYTRTDTDGALVFATTATSGQLADVVRKLTNGTLEYRQGDGETWRFDAQGRATAMVDRNGNTTTLTYTGANLTRITDAVGRQLNLGYTGSVITSATDPLGRVWRFAYNGNLLTTVTDPLSFTMTYGYSIAGLLTSVTDGRGFVQKRITYSTGAPRVIRQEFADGGFETYQYTLAGTVVTETKLTDVLGRVMTKRFNAAGYVIGEIDELGQASTIERDMLTNVAKRTTGPCGCPEATRTFDALGNLKSSTDRRGQRTEYDYDPNFNFVTLIRDTLGHATQSAYDNRGNRVSTTDALGRVTTYAYDGFGQLISVTDPLSHIARLEYDANGYVAKVTDALGNMRIFEYDLVGRLKKLTDGEGRQTIFAYDDNDRLITVTDPASVVTRYEYDQEDNRTAIVNAQNRRWSFVYDAKNRLTKSTDPLNHTTQSRYNADDELVALVSPSGRTTRHEYDSRGQRTKLIDPLRGETRFTYDSQRNLTTLTDQRGNTTTFTYDELYRLTAQRDPLGRTATFGYDAASRLVEKVDRLNRRTSFDYDALNRLATVTYVDATVSYTYDEAGRLTKVGDTQAGDIVWTYDAADRRLSERTPQGLVGYIYNKADQRTMLTAADRSPVSYEYDSAGRLLRITQGGEVFSWSYDDLARVRELQRPNGVTTTYGYDAADKPNRLTHANAVGAALEDLQYDYSADNEIESIASLANGTVLPTPKTASAADAANRFTRFGPAGYTFDDEGQTRTKTDSQGTTTYDWDARGRLVKVTLPNAQTVGYNYDALGRRVNRLAGGLTTNFLYDNDEVVLDRNNAGTVTDYLNGPRIDHKLRQASTGTGAVYFLQDHLNGTIGLVNASGGVVERLPYEAYGASAGSALTRYDYTGRERDAVTGLLFYRARWYDPQQGRFISQDPVGFAGGDLDLYAYVANNPLGSADPYGLWATGGKAPANVNTIVCDGAGGIKVQTGATGDAAQSKCLTGCIIKHEESHKSDALAANPDVCKGKPAGARVNASDAKEAKASELAAYTVETNCLKGQLKSCKKECKAIIEQRIKQIEPYTVP